MIRFWRAAVWFNRLVLTGATLVMAAIALRHLRDPVAATVPLGITLGSPTAITVVRVGLGGFPLGFAIALAACLGSTRRLLTGVSLVAAVIGAATLARLQGIALDGATPYNVSLLRPEIAMLTLSGVGIVLERRRRARFAAPVGDGGQAVATS